MNSVDAEKLHEAGVSGAQRERGLCARGGGGLRRAARPDACRDRGHNSKEVSAAIKAALLRGLEKCGLVAEGYAKKLCPVDTGNLRNSITHVVDEQEPAAIIGTNNEYAAYVELGTGKYAEGGRPTPWVYQDAKGNWHMTHGNKAQPFLKPAAADHAGQYRDILENELKNG